MRSDRPVPLTQTFVGVSKNNVQERNKLFLEIAYDKALAAIRNHTEARTLQ